MSPADVTVEFVEHEIKGFKLHLIKEPLPGHVVAWEQASRALKNEDAKPLLNSAVAELQRTTITDDSAVLLNVLRLVSESLDAALKIINDNEALTLSSNRGVMVKAAVEAKWIVALYRKDRKEDGSEQWTQIMETTGEVDHMKPWLVHWIAEKVATLYLEVTNIPKN